HTHGLPGGAYRRSLFAGRQTALLPLAVQFHLAHPATVARRLLHRSPRRRLELYHLPSLAVLLLAGYAWIRRSLSLVGGANYDPGRGQTGAAARPPGRTAAGDRAALCAVFADAFCRGKPLPRAVRTAGSPWPLPPCAVGIRVRVSHHAAVCAAPVFA